jgi:hypothetical protein
MISLFVNGTMLFHGDDDHRETTPLTVDARPGQKFLLAVRADAQEKEAQISRSRLIVEPPASRSSPTFLREEILAVRPIIEAYREGKAEREAQVDAAANRYFH